MVLSSNMVDWGIMKVMVLQIFFPSLQFSQKNNDGNYYIRTNHILKKNKRVELAIHFGIIFQHIFLLNEIHVDVTKISRNHLNFD